MNLKIDKSIIWWLKKAKREGLDSILLTLTPTGIKVNQADDNASFVIDGFLSKKDSSIVTYELEEKKEVMLPIPDFGTFCNLMETFDDLIQLVMDKVILNLKSPNKEIFYQLVDLEFIKGVGKQPKVTYDLVVPIKKSILVGVVKDARELDAIKVVLEQKDSGTLEILVHSERHKSSFKVETGVKENRTVVLPRHTLEDTVVSLSEDLVEIVFATGSNSVQIKERTDNFYMVTTLAGVVK